MKRIKILMVSSLVLFFAEIGSCGIVVFGSPVSVLDTGGGSTIINCGPEMGVCARIERTEQGIRAVTESQGEFKGRSYTITGNTIVIKN